MTAAQSLEFQNESAGWTPLQFYAWIVRNVGLPASFKRQADGQWVGEAPFTKPVPQSVLDMLEAEGV